MKTPYLYFSLCFAIFYSCTSVSKDDKVTSPDIIEQKEKVLKKDWLLAFNGQFELNDLYIKDAILVEENGTIYEDSISRASYFKKLKEEAGIFQNSKILFDSLTVRDIRYQLGRLKNANGDFYKYLSTQEPNGLRALEFYAKTTPNYKIDLKEIDAVREKWMRLCNQHDARKLVEELYTENAIYYNHKPVVVGTKNISEEYGYMNNPEYRLKLTPLIVEPVHEKLVFEIGQCSGSYGGKYVLAWQKNENGVWKILLDSNV